MKKIFSVLAAALMSFSALAVDSSVAENYDLLTPANQAKADQGKIAFVKVVEKAAPDVKPSNVGTITQRLVVQETCFASLIVETNNYATTGGGCGEGPVEYLDSANVAVDIDFETFYYEDLTDIQVILYATDKYTGRTVEIDNIAFTYQSAGFLGANTVVFVVDAAYANDYTLSADVYLDDERGTACIIETNGDTIYE